MLLIPFALHSKKGETLGKDNRLVIAKDWGLGEALTKCIRVFWGSDGTFQYPGISGGYLTMHLAKLIKLYTKVGGFYSVNYTSISLT